MKLKLIYLNQVQVLDRSTGEIETMNTSKTFVVKSKGEPFWITYLDYITPLFGLSNKSDARDVLYLLLLNTKYNSGKVTLSPNERKDICAKLDISNAGLTNHLNKLKEHGIISGTRGDYMINPQMFWKGTAAARDAILNQGELHLSFNLVPPADLDSVQILPNSNFDKKGNESV